MIPFAPAPGPDGLTFHVACGTDSPAPDEIGHPVTIGLLAHRWWGADLPDTPEWATRVECVLD